VAPLEVTAPAVYLLRVTAPEADLLRVNAPEADPQKAAVLVAVRPKAIEVVPLIVIVPGVVLPKVDVLVAAVQNIRDHPVEIGRAVVVLAATKILAKSKHLYLPFTTVKIT